MANLAAGRGAAKPAPRTTLNIRIKVPQRDLIGRAAQAQGKTRTDFILEASCRAAEEALLDRTEFAAEAEAVAAFLARLDAPPAPSDRLRRTMAAKKPWDPA